MAVIDGIPPLSTWQSRPTKLHAYEALQTLNRCFEATLLSLERLDHLGLFRADEPEPVDRTLGGGRILAWAFRSTSLKKKLHC